MILENLKYKQLIILPINMDMQYNKIVKLIHRLTIQSEILSFLKMDNVIKILIYFYLKYWEFKDTLLTFVM